MPNYDYQCQDCGHKFEKFQNMTEKPIKKCPKCQGKVQRLIGAGMGIIFKGPGFYSTDYRKETSSGRTCCGRDEPCDKPPCSDGGVCKR